MALSFLLVLVLVGCQGSDTGFYDEAAKDEALRAASKGPFDGQDEVVSVGSAHERDECPQAPSPQAGPCLKVPVTSAVQARELSGKEVGLTVQIEGDFFVWLERRRDGRWKVSHTTWRPKGVSANGRAYTPQQ